MVSYAGCESCVEAYVVIFSYMMFCLTPLL